MNNKEINAAIAELNEAIFCLEEEYSENGGEVTEETIAQEEYIEQLKALLEGEGIDSLGRWLKAKEDSIKALKAERDCVNRQIKKTEDGIEFIKSQIFNVMSAIGAEKVKGTFYSFAPSVSRKTEVDKEKLEERYMAEVNLALEKVLPAWVSYKLSASVKAVPEGMELPGIFKVTETPSCRFVKPRAKKEVANGEDC
jgi:hypothetical protein